jgi:ubiquitin carboxyl-terminal hydrolase 4/11/15
MPSRSTDHQSAAAEAVAAAAPSSSLKRKEDGNRFFSMKKYSVAIACYRSGLAELKNIDRSSSPSSNNNDEIINLEISLRSNIALALLKLANPQSIQEYNQPGVATNDITKREYCMEVTSECTAALELDRENAKLYHRRGQARQLLAELDDIDDDGDDDDGISKQWGLAEEDFSQSVQLLQEQLQQQLKDGSNQNDNNACRKQLADANRALEKLRVTMKENQMKRSESISTSTSVEREQKQQQSSTLSTATDCDENFDDDVTNTNLPPSPETQREYILELLSRCANTPTPPAKSGEAYFLINMEWWQSWCCYVGLFSLYTDTTATAVATTTGEGGNMGRIEIKRHCRTIDMANLQLLKLLPPGATLPPYYEQNRNEALTSVDDEEGEEKKKKKNQSRGRSDDSSYTSSEEDSDDESKIEEGTFPSPGVIDNSSLILPRNNEGWCCPIEYDSDQQEDEKSSEEESPSWALLKNHLVRGYHFELLPREAYVALRSWYGESSPHIIRRVEDVDGNVQVIQYPEQWDAVSRCVNELPGTKCSACGSPTGTKTCTKCGVAHYCNRRCQVNHWSYHKKICQTLKIGGLGAGGNDLLDYSRWGRVGLNNLGNTCFLNSAMQCMMHVAPLTRYFLSNRFSEDVNNHNILGTGGKVANAYSAVLKDLWMGGHIYHNVSPTSLKRAIELFAPQFSGASQQDSAELITYLLDALHEDLNRVKNPPYVEMPDVDLGRKLSISGAEAWKLSCIRNDSFVYDNFYGLYKSKCVCPHCDKVTIKFDPFNHITLEIPQQPLRHIVVVLFRDSDEVGPELPTKFIISLSHTSTMIGLKERLRELSGTSLSRLSVCGIDFDDRKIRDVYNDQQPISVIPPNGTVVAYEADTNTRDDNTIIPCVVTQYALDSNLVEVGGMNRQAVGIPLLFSIDASLSCAQIYDKTLTYVISYAKDSSGCVMSKKALRKNLRLRISTQDGPPTDVFLSPEDNQSFLSFLEANRIEFSHYFDLEWVDLIDFGRDGTKIHYSNFTSMKCDPSYTEREHKLRSDPNSVSLYECFESFTQPERLDDDNMLYCSGCKKHGRAMKTVTLWRIPKILVVHLKRFEYRGTFNRSKIGVLVDFPLDGLDLSHHSTHNINGADFVNDSVPLMYDLFGCVNHYGRMGFGHYTAHARRWDETGAEQGWAEFDDENVTNVSNAESIVSPAAYVLFYKRRLFV